MPSEEIMNNIVQVAREIFTKYGFKKTTMDDIAYTVRKGKSSIYYYFRSKEELFEAVVEHEISMLRNTLRENLDNENDPKEKLKIYIITRMKKFKELINAYNALSDEYLEQFSFIEKIRQKYDEEEIRMIKGILEDGIKKNTFLVTDLEMSSFAIVTTMKGMEYPLIIKNPNISLEKTIVSLLNLLFYGIMKK